MTSQQSIHEIIYHPGPPKTATTSLQCALTRYRHELEKDNYIYVGKVPSKFCPLAKDETLAHHTKALQCLFNTTCLFFVNRAYRDKGQIHPRWRLVQRQMQELYAQNVSLILSDEVHALLLYTGEKESSSTCKYCKIPSLLRHLFQNWTVRPVIGYRYYWDFWLSVRHEEDRITPNRRQLQEWKGRRLKSLLVHLQEEVEANDFLEPNSLSLLKELYAQGEQQQQNFVSRPTLIHVGRHKDPIQHFLCQILSAPTACHRVVKESHKEMIRLNPSTGSLSDYDRLAVRAWDMGWIHSNATRHQVYEMILGQTSRLNVSTQCPPPHHLALLRDKSRAFAKNVAEVMRGSGGATAWDLAGNDDEKHDRLLTSHTSNFCVIDVNRTLEEVKFGWKFFFRTVVLSDFKVSLGR